MTRAIDAVTFDIWDTLVRDESDEPKRAALGLEPKRQARRRLVWEALSREAPIDLAAVSLAYDTTDAAFSHVWHDQHVTWPVRERLGIVLAGLGRTLPAEAFAEVVRATEGMEVEVPPDLIEGAAQAVAELATRYKLCIISDAIVSPGRALRRLLAHHGIVQHFQGFAFSDEVPHSKPHRDMFQAAADQLGVPFSRMVHIGDREHNDVRGPHALGMKAILFTAARTKDLEGTTADAVCARHDALVAAIDALAGGAQ